MPWNVVSAVKLTHTMSPLEESVSELAAAKAGLGSKKVHSFVVLLKSHTRTRLSDAISSANTVSVALTVTVGVVTAASTVKLVLAVTDDVPLPMVTSNALLPTESCGTKKVAVKSPSESVDGLGTGRADTPPKVRADMDTKPGNPVPVATAVEPEGPLEDSTTMDAPGTLWVAVLLADALPSVVDDAVMVLVDGILAVVGTVKEPVKVPVLLALTVATVGEELVLT